MTEMVPKKSSQESPPVVIGNRLELFVDHHLLDVLRGTSLRLHSPNRMPKPSSPFTGVFMTVIKDGDLYRGYSRQYKPGFQGKRVDGNEGECTCYFESRDGIEWEAPNLGLVPEDAHGYMPNAILSESPFSHNFSPFLDARPDVPEQERFKALAGVRKSGLYAFASANGIQWRKLQDRPVLEYCRELHSNNAFDCQNLAFWSEEEGCYLSFFRSLSTVHQGIRTIRRARSPDFLNWEDESATFEPANLPEEQLYTNQTHPYFRAPHLYIALPTRFTLGYVRGVAHYRDEEPERLANIGSTDVQFMTLRAGNNGYDRTFKETFLRPGVDPAGWENRANFLALNVVPTGPAEMSMYNRDGSRYVLRTDGFASVNAPYEEGEMVTKPLIFEGDELLLNVSTSIRGGVRVELQNSDGESLPGFALDNCVPIIDDCVEHVVHWREGNSVGRYAGQPIRLRFVMSDSDLFSLRFR